MKFIPVEAVAAIVQCKSYNLSDVNLKEWVESINKLKTSDNSVVRIASCIMNKPANTQKATRPIKILCYMEKIEESVDKEREHENFDITMIATLNAKTNDKKLKIFFSDDNKDLWKIFTRHNFANEEDEGLCEKFYNQELEETEIVESYSIKPLGEHNLLSFIFQFNQMLMLINNLMFFPHRAYVEMFNKNIMDNDTKEG